jgi:hypothetical protein
MCSSENTFDTGLSEFESVCVFRSGRSNQHTIKGAAAVNKPVDRLEGFVFHPRVNDQAAPTLTPDLPRESRMADGRELGLAQSVKAGLTGGL